MRLERQGTKPHIGNEPRVNEPIEQNFLHDPTWCSRRPCMEGAGSDVLHPRWRVLEEGAHVDVLTAVAVRTDQEDPKRSRAAIP
jgi:hypothetical protein